MIARSSLLPTFLLFGGCSLIAGDTPRLHDPSLSISELARTGDANSAVFKSYNPNGPVRWNQGWPWKFDLTGIGWDISTTVTAITPRHVVMANHYHRKVGDPAVFHDRKGKPHRRVIQKIVPTSKFGLKSDVAVGLLDRPLPDSIRSYPLIKATQEEAKKLVGTHALVTEQDRRLFIHQIYLVSESFIRFRYDPRLHDSKKKRLISGDSGNPSFLLTHGELALIETHTGGGPGAGPFYGSTKMIAVLRKIIAQLDSNYQLRTVGIDRTVMKEAEAGRAAMPKPPTPATSRPKPSAHPTSTPSRKPRPRVVIPASP